MKQHNNSHLAYFPTFTYGDYTECSTTRKLTITKKNYKFQSTNLEEFQKWSKGVDSNFSLQVGSKGIGAYPNGYLAVLEQLEDRQKQVYATNS